MMMIGWALLAYGTVGCLGSLVWLGVMLAHGSDGLPSPAITVTLFVVHGVAIVLTVQQGLPPLVTVTAGRVRVARIVLGGAIMTFLLGTMLLVASRDTSYVSATTVMIWFDGFIFLNMLYIVLHWALRPANILTPDLASFLANPVVHMMRATQMRKHKAARHDRRVTQRNTER
jgi:hypothetical protein